MNTCKTCVFWENNHCDLPDIRYRPNKNPNADVEIEWDADDDSGLTISLKTGPDFGCVHHQEKSA